MAENLSFWIQAKDGFSKAFSTLDTRLKKSNANMKSFRMSLGTVGTQFKQLSSQFGAFIGAAGFIMASKKMISTMVDFEAGMTSVATLVDTSKVDMTAYGKAVVEMSSRVGRSAVDLAGGLYQVVSAGVDTSYSLEVLEVSAMAAKAGLTTTTDAVDIITTALNAYSMSASEAGRVSDILFTTVRLGKTTFPELSGSLGQLLPFADQLKISFEEVGAAMSTLTAAGINTEISTTALRAAFVSFVNQASKFEEKNVDILKVIKEDGLAGALKVLKDLTGGNVKEMTKLVPETRALAAMLTLTGAGAEKFASDLLEMKDASGATKDAFNKQMATAKTAMESVTIAFEKLSLMMSDTGLPAIKNISKAVVWLIEGFLSLGTNIGKTIFLFVESFKGAIKWTGDLISVLWDLVSIAGDVGSVIKSAFTLDFAGIAEGFESAKQTFIDSGKKIGHLITEGTKNAFISDDILADLFDIPTSGRIGKGGTKKPSKPSPEIQALLDAADAADKAAKERADAADKAAKERADAAKKALESLSGEYDNYYKTELQRLDEWYATQKELFKGHEEELGILKDVYNAKKEEIDEKAFESTQKLMDETHDAYKEQFSSDLELLDEKYLAEMDLLAGHQEAQMELTQVFLEQKAELEEEARQADHEKWLENLDDMSRELFEWSEEQPSLAKVTGETITGIFDKVSDGVAKSTAEAIINGKNMGESMKNLMKSVGVFVIQTLIKTGIQRLITSVLTIGAEEAEGAAELGSSLAAVYTNSFASAAAIPVVGWAMAPGVAMGNLGLAISGASTAKLTGMGIGGAIHGGIENIPKEQTYLLDEGERVLSPNQNRDLTNFLEEGGEPSGVPIQINMEVLPNATNLDALLSMSETDWLDIVQDKVMPAFRSLQTKGVEV